jgi:hypothetical protein
MDGDTTGGIGFRTGKECRGKRLEISGVEIDCVEVFPL